MIEVRHLTKRYGPVLAVDDLSFTVAAGQVTGFLGPNGSGKSTTMPMIVGLDAQALLAPKHAGLSIADPGVLRAVTAGLIAAGRS